MRVIEHLSFSFNLFFNSRIMVNEDKKQKTIVIGAGPVGALAALYAAQRGHEVEIYELRSGTLAFS
jgi:NADPH-dependent 2,4-dienoyl-CoA reductase/sulfur reductase-like enzyme